MRLILPSAMKRPPTGERSMVMRTSSRVMTVAFIRVGR